MFQIDPAPLSHVSTTDASSSDLKSVALDQEVSRMKLPKVDFLKIDVEGHEEFALLGASQLLTSETPPVLLFEFVPFFRPRWKQGAIQTLKNMLKPGWTGLALGFDGSKKEWYDWSEAAANTNYLLIPPHRSELLRELK
ncbi:MAG: FkbM family methyltransferase [Gemmatales bacterium]